MRSGSKRVMLFIVLIIFGVILAVLSLHLTTTEKEFKNAMVVSDSKCSLEKRQSLIDSPLPIKVDENVRIDELESSGCFVINTSNTGIWRLVEERNFENIRCEPTEKRFLGPPRNKTRIALMSFPGSGNTWLRYLLEETTGIYTGAIYNDKRLLTMFPGEGTTENVIAIKTHRGATNAEYDKTIVIVRDIFEAVVSNFNRQFTKNHTGVMDKSAFNVTEFKKVVSSSSNMTTTIKVINTFMGDMFILFYDRLKADLLNSLTKLVAFCNAEVTLKRLWCTYKNSEGYAYRGQKPAWMSRKSLVDAEMERNISNGKGALHMAIENRKFNCVTN